ncbi:Glutamyl-tRNA(Gln) amidotransferase subunit A [Thalictrum thalictroides]|uniref:Glutamyl-tRNA(Gln) amidotransferase subunit A n=1 Tax=Thalictrum thalictroides TaxID=46969 RepID=A0A7J6WIH7_THATH|nr:Glutamyl-tRNA(Gln) amidotransferase subunit A [Thalictrum thalictroides]
MAGAAMLRDHQVQVHFLFNFLLLLIIIAPPISGHQFRIKEATISEIQNAFQHEQLTSRQLVMFYLREISKLNPLLRGVIEINPDAIYLADKADKERKSSIRGGYSSRLHHLHGIPILLKDNIATKDRMNTTAGSLALLGSIVPRDAGVVKKLRKAGAIILGKASLSEWAHFRSFTAPSGWNARSGQGKNPYVLSEDPCGSSSGSAISVAANLATVTLGTETDGSILCPSDSNSVVGIKPTVGLTSRSGVIPISPRQDTVGPICRTVADAVYVLDTIVGFDKRDDATTVASKFIPKGGYLQFLKPDGLKRKRLGILRNPLFSPDSDSIVTLRQQGAVLVDNLNISHLDIILDSSKSGELTALAIEFKVALNAYLKELVASPVRSLEDVIAFNKKFSDLEKIDEYGQDLFLLSQATNEIGDKEKPLQSRLEKLSRDGLEKLMKEHMLDALVTPGHEISSVLAIGGLPGISVPAGYNPKGVPFGICFGGRKGSEPKLIEIAYAFEQATRVRKPPSFKP